MERTRKKRRDWSRYATNPDYLEVVTFFRRMHPDAVRSVPVDADGWPVDEDVVVGALKKARTMKTKEGRLYTGSTRLRWVVAAFAQVRAEMLANVTVIPRDG